MLIMICWCDYAGLITYPCISFYPQVMDSSQWSLECKTITYPCQDVRPLLFQETI